MGWRETWRKLLDNPIVEWSIFAVGVMLLIISPLVGVIPGPGGIVVAGIGLALVLKTSMWAKRRYVKFKRWQPKAGRWADWGLQRRSARRREELRKEHEERRKLDGAANAPAEAQVNAPSDVHGD